jgi:hypothetical protein
MRFEAVARRIPINPPSEKALIAEQSAINAGK